MQHHVWLCLPHGVGEADRVADVGLVVGFYEILKPGGHVERRRGRGPQ